MSNSKVPYNPGEVVSSISSLSPIKVRQVYVPGLALEGKPRPDYIPDQALTTILEALEKLAKK